MVPCALLGCAGDKEEPPGTGPDTPEIAAQDTASGDGAPSDSVGPWEVPSSDGAAIDLADAAPDPCEGLGPECLPVVERGNINVVYLHGTPREMGFQHGSLLKAELAEGVAEIEGNLVLAAMKQMALDLGLLTLAQELSTEEIVEECQGMVEAAGDVGWTVEDCMVLNFGDAIAEFIQDGAPGKDDIVPGCSQVVASGKATADGRLYHLRILDWAQIDFILDNPVVFVRSPTGGIPHVFIGFPGNLSPYQGMNAMGLVSASNEVHARDSSVHDAVGISHVQLQGRVLATAHDVGEAAAAIAQANHMTLETIVVSDQDSGEVLEMSPPAVATRKQAEGIVFATNHFVADSTSGLDKEPTPQHSTLRFDRLFQLLDPAAPNTLYGKLTPELLVQVARDRIDPYTGQESPADVFDNAQSLATNGALFVVVFDPADLRFWVAAGKIPVPSQPLVGFSLGHLLNLPGYEGTTPPDIP